MLELVQKYLYVAIFLQAFAHVALTYKKRCCPQKKSIHAFGLIPSFLGVIFTSEKGILSTGWGEAQRKEMCVYCCVLVCVCFCLQSSLVRNAGNSCKQDFLTCTGNKMAENGRLGTMLWKSATTQVRGWGACESESWEVNGARPFAAA